MGINNINWCKFIKHPMLIQRNQFDMFKMKDNLKTETALNVPPNQIKIMPFLDLGALFNTNNKVVTLNNGGAQPIDGDLENIRENGVNNENFDALKNKESLNELITQVAITYFIVGVQTNFIYGNERREVSLADNSSLTRRKILKYALYVAVGTTITILVYEYSIRKFIFKVEAEEIKEIILEKVIDIPNGSYFDSFEFGNLISSKNISSVIKSGLIRIRIIKNPFIYILSLILVRPLMLLKRIFNRK